MPFDYQGAIAGGYTDREIADYLSAQAQSFDLQGARDGGYSDGEIVQYLLGDGATTTPVPAEKPGYNILGGIADIGRGVYDLPTNIMGSLGDLLESKNPRESEDFKDEWRRERDLRIAERAILPGGEEKVFPGISRKDIRDASGSAGFSAVSMLGGLIGGAAALPIPVPGARIAGALAGSGATAYEIGKAQITETLLKALDQTTMETEGREATPEEAEKYLEQTDGLITKHALWEAIPEAAGNLAMMTGIGALFTKALGKKVGARVFRKVAGMYGAELGTETITQMGQQQVESDLGLTDEKKRSFTSPKDIYTSFKEVAPQTAVLVTGMGGGAHVAGKISKPLLEKALAGKKLNADESKQLKDEIDSLEFEKPKPKETMTSRREEAQEEKNKPGVSEQDLAKVKLTEEEIANLPEPTIESFPERDREVAKEALKKLDKTVGEKKTAKESAYSIPVIKREYLIKEDSMKDRVSVTNSAMAAASLKQYGKGKDGVLLLDQNNVPVAFIPFVEGKTAKETTRELLILQAHSNASFAVVKNDSDRKGRAEYIDALLSTTETNINGKIERRSLFGDLRLLDYIQKGKSLADSGHLARLDVGSARFDTLMGETKLNVAPTKKQLRKAQVTVRQFRSWMRKAGLPKDVLGKLEIEAGEVIKQLGDYRKSMKEHRLNSYNEKMAVGATTFFDDAHVLVQYAIDQGLIRGEKTAYHEAFHVMLNRLVSAKDKETLLSHFNGNEEDAAKAYATFVVDKETLAGAKPIRKIFWKIERALKRIANGFKASKYETVDEFFEGLYFGGFKGAGEARPGQQTKLQASAPPFFSNLTRAVENGLKDMPAKAQAITNWLQKKQVKPSEMKWMGVEQWLKDNARDGKVDREAFLAFLKSNEISVTEVEKGSGVTHERLKWIKRGNFYKPSSEFSIGKIEYLPSNGKYVYESLGGTKDVFDTLDEAKDAALRVASNVGIDNAKFNRPDLNLPGGKDSRELLFLLPESTKPNEARSQFEERMIAKYGTFAMSRFTETEMQENKATLQSVLDNDPYKSSHWDEPNVLGHVRFNERTDSQGNRVLFIEELQSDWHQTGKKEGMKGKSPTDAEVREFFDLKPEANPSDYREEMMGHKDYKPVPKAPFAENWHEVLLKRMIRYAAENGFDSVAWTTGEQQAERYDLSKHLDSIRYDPVIDDTGKPTGDYDFEAFDKNGDIVIYHEEASLEKIEELAGKEIAQKVQNGEGRSLAEERPLRPGWMSLEGLDLKVGGAGMKSFYDQLLPGFAKKYVKQWGSSVGTSEIETELAGPFKTEYRVYDEDGTLKLTVGSERDAELYLKDPDRTNYRLEVVKHGMESVSVPSIKITDEMRESVVMEGQSWFAMNGKSGEPTRIIKAQAEQAKKKADVKEAIKNLKNATVKNVLDNARKTTKGRGFPTQVLSTKDMKWYHRALETPYVLAKKFEGMKHALAIELERLESRTKYLFNVYDKGLKETQDSISKDKKKNAKFWKLVWKMEGKRFSKKYVPTNWHGPLVEGETIEINKKHYDEVRRYLLDKGIDLEIVDGFVTLRQELDKVLVEADRMMRTNDIAPDDIAEFRSNIDITHNYFPHKRSGDAYINIKDKKGEIVYTRHFWTKRELLLSDEQKAPAVARKWLEEANLPGKLSDYTVMKPFKITKMPDEVFFSFDTTAAQQIVNEAARKVAAENKELTKAEKESYRKQMEESLSQAVADVVKTRGWAGHSVHRKGTPGYEMEDGWGTMFDYLSGFSGFRTKIMAAKEHTKNLYNIEASRRPNEYKYVSNYVRDMLANSNRTDRIVDGLRAVFFVKYLGFVPKSGLVNLTQNVVMAAPILSIYTKKANRKLARAMIDVRQGLTDKRAWTGKPIEYKTLKEKREADALKQMLEVGATQDLFLRELQGALPGSGFGSTAKKIMDKAGIFMQVAEKFNRASTGLCAYRVAYDEGALHDGKQTKGDNDLSVAFAKQIVYDTHFLYGQSNLPSSMRGGDFRKTIRAAYTFRSFTHNYLDMMTHVALNQKGGGKAVLRSLRNLFLIGGLSSIPFFKAASEAFQWALGDDDEDAMTKIREAMPNAFLKDFMVYGLVGALGGDISGSMSIEVPRNWKDIVGVPYAIIEDTMNTIESIQSGAYYRAVSGTPFTPISVRNAMRGIELATTGQRTRSGKDINVIGAVGPKKISGVQAMSKILGIQPTALSKGYASYSARRKLEEGMKRRKAKWADRYVNAVNDGNERARQSVLREMIEWNESVFEEGKDWKAVNIRDLIKNRLRRNRKPMTSIPKQLRGEAYKISETWK